MELTFTPEEEAFRTEVRSFLKEHLPERLSSQIRDGLQLSKADMEEWHAILNRQGWLANHWVSRVARSMAVAAVKAPRVRASRAVRSCLGVWGFEEAVTGQAHGQIEPNCR